MLPGAYRTVTPRPSGVRAGRVLAGGGRLARHGLGGRRRLGTGRRLLLRRRHAELGRLHRGPGGPAPAAGDGQLAEQLDGARVVVAGAALDGSVLQHLDDDLATEVGADDRQRPVIEGADAAGGDVGVLGGEVRTRLAAFAGPRVALLERYLVVAA